MKKRLGRALNAITFLCISLVCVIGLGFGLKASGVTGENFVTKLLAFGGTTSDDDYTKGPERSKIATPNGDGSYKLSLSVTGKTETKENYKKANVVVVLDISGSMDCVASKAGVKLINDGKTIAYFSEPDSDGDYWRLYYYYSKDGKYYPEGTGPEKDKRHGTVYTASGGISASGTIDYRKYTSYRYNFDDNSTRLDQTKAGVKDAVETLLSQNSASVADMVELSLMTFSTYANYVTPNSAQATGWISGSDTSAIDTIVDGVAAAGATNWDAALYKAKALLDAKANVDKNDDNFIVLFSDGEPTVYAGSVSGNTHTHNDNSSNAYNPSQSDSRKAAFAEAKKLYTEEYKLFGIFAYGNDVGKGYMDTLVSYANYNNSNSNVDGVYSFAANSKDDIDTAFSAITSHISNTVGFEDVSIIDGTTANVATSSGISHLLDVDPDSFKYYRNGQPWEDAPKAFYDNREKIEKDGKMVANPAYGSVSWDLGDGLLDNGVKYTVTFDVWPSQYTLDLIADLKNGAKDYDEDLDDNEKLYIGRDYSLGTNTEATVSYTDTRTNDGPQVAKFKNPDKVPTKTYVMNVQKLWTNGVDTRLIPGAGIQLKVLRDGEAVEKTGVSVSDTSSWKGHVDIAIGMLKYDANTGVVKIMEKGHEYTLAEPEGLTYHWELDSKVVRPMMINSVVKVLVKDTKVSFDEDYKRITGEDEVEREYFKIDGKFYYVDEELNQLTATNYRRSNLNLTKVVTGEKAPEDAMFTYDLSVANSMADLTDGKPSDDDEIWFSICDPKMNEDCDNTDSSTYKPVIDVDTTAEAEMKDGEKTGYYKFTSGQEVTVSLKAGWNLRITNLPTGSTYSISESAMPTGFEFESVTTEGTKDGKAVSGTIKEYNKKYNNVYTNKYVLKDVVVNKVWDDRGNQDGIRPPELSLVLRANGDVVSGVTPEVTKNGNTWTYTYKALPADKTYTVDEPAVPEGYKATVDGLTITNYHKTAVRDITVSKVWDDDNNRDGIQPPSVTVQLKADGKDYGNPVVLNADNEWSYTFEDLDTNKDGKAINYTVSEVNVPKDYKDSVDGFVVTNTHNPETTKLSVHKVWDDNDNQDGERPSSVTVKLMIGTEQAKDIKGNAVVLTLNEDNDWTSESSDVYVKANGTVIDYTWVEETVGHDYILTGNEESEDVANLTIITNKRALEETEATVKKEWNDGGNRDNLRTASVSVKLLADGTPIKDSEGQDKVFTLSSSNNWEHKETGLPKKSSGKEINYTWVEVNVPTGYKDPTIVKNGTITTITNNHDIATTTATFTKIWDDKGNQDKVRPDAIELELYADGNKVTEEVVPTIVKNDNTWTITYSGLPKNSAGEEIDYTIKEINVDSHYKAEESKDGKTITNTHEVETIDIKASKTWVDGGNRDKKRPSSITLKLKNKATGEVVRTETMEPDENGNWNHTFAKVDKNKDGVEVIYELEEVSVPYYLTDPIVGDQKTGFTIKNSYTPETITYTGNKVWSDDNNRDGIQPPSVTVVLKVDGEIVARALVNAESNWTYSFTVPKNDAGEAIPYVLEELPVEGYKASISKGVVSEDGKVITNTITNTHEVDKTTLRGTKHWVDDDNQDGLRPDSVTIKLLANGHQAKDIHNVDMIATVTGPEWTYTFADVPVNEAGEEIEYTVEEVQDSEKHITDNVKTGYKATYDGLDVINTHESAIKSITTHKVWNDKEDNDDVRPDEITVRLWALEDGQKVEKDHKAVTAEDEWSAVFKKLPVYNDGVEIVYSITEDDVEGYTADIPEGSYTITNNHKLQTTSFTVSKEWNDDDDRDGKRPGSVVVTLFADGNIVKDENGREVSATLSSDNGWKYTFEKLQKKNNKKDIVYTVVEEDTGVDGYSATYRTCSEEEANEGKCVKGVYVVTNTYDPEKTTVTVVKSWDDDSNRDGIQPDSVTVKLIADDEDVLDEEGKNVTLELTSEKGWTDTFKDLNKYRDGGEEIVYSVEEMEVAEGYDASVSKTTCEEDEEDCIPGIYIITNKHDIETVDVLGEVFWDDVDDQDGVRPEDVTICVHANGELVECMNVTPDDDSWKYAFEDLPKNKDGEEIKYTVTEDDIEYYEIKPEGYNFTNKHVPDEGEVLGESEEFCEDCGVAGEKKENDSDNPETGDTILPYALLLLTSLGGMSFTAKKIVDRQK